MIEETQVVRTAVNKTETDVTPSVDRLLRTAIGWGFGWGFGCSISIGSIFAFGIVLSNAIATASVVQWVFAISIALAIVVTSGGLLTSRELRQKAPSIPRQQVLVVAASWTTSLTIGLIIGGIIPWFVLFRFLPNWTIVAWVITVAIGGGALMFWQLGRLGPAPKALLKRTAVEPRAIHWTFGRSATLFLLLVGFSGPWTSCTPCFMCSSEETFTGLQLLWRFHIVVALFLAPLLLLLAVTFLRIFESGAVLTWLERFAAAGSLLITGLLRPWDGTWFWGFRVTAAGVLVAVLNLIGEWITIRKPRL